MNIILSTNILFIMFKSLKRIVIVEFTFLIRSGTFNQSTFLRVLVFLILNYFLGSPISKFSKAL